MVSTVIALEKTTSHGNVVLNLPTVELIFYLFTQPRVQWAGSTTTLDSAQNAL